MNKLQRTLSNLEKAETDRAKRISLFANKPIQIRSPPQKCIGSKISYKETFNSFTKKSICKNQNETQETTEYQDYDNLGSKISDRSDSLVLNERNEKNYQSPCVDLPQKYIRLVPENLHGLKRNPFKNQKSSKSFTKNISNEDLIGRSLAMKNIYRIKNLSNKNLQSVSHSAIRTHNFFENEVHKFKNNFFKLATEPNYTQDEFDIDKPENYDYSVNFKKNLVESVLIQKYNTFYDNNYMKKPTKKDTMENTKTTLTRDEVNSSNYSSIKNLQVNHNYITDNFKDIIKGKMNTNRAIALENRKYDTKKIRFGNLAKEKHEIIKSLGKSTKKNVSQRNMHSENLASNTETYNNTELSMSNFQHKMNLRLDLTTSPLQFGVDTNKSFSPLYQQKYKEKSVVLNRNNKNSKSSNWLMHLT